MAQGTGLPLDKVGGEIVQGPGALQSTDPGAAAWGRIAGAGERLESVGFNQLNLAEYQRAVGSEIDSDNKDAEARAKIMSTMPKEQWASAFQEYSAGRQEVADSRDALGLRRKHGQIVNQLKLTSAAEIAGDNERNAKEDITKGLTRVGSELEGIAGAGKMGTPEWDAKVKEMESIGQSAIKARLHSPESVGYIIEDSKTAAMGQVAIRSAEAVYQNDGYEAAVKHLQETVRDNDELKMSTSKRFATYSKGLQALRALKLGDAGNRKEVVDSANDLVAQMQAGTSLLPGVYDSTLAAARKVGALPTVNKLIVAKAESDWRMQTAGMTLPQQVATLQGVTAQRAVETVGANFVPTLATARQPFAAELQNENLRRRMVAYIAAEAGHKSIQTQIAFAESVLNRGNARGDTLDATLPATGRATVQGQYFPNETHAKVRAGVSEDTYQRLNSIIDVALGGSNLSKYATGNASLNVGFGYGRGAADPFFFKSDINERFGPENNKKDLAWIAQMRSAQGGEGSVPFTSGTHQPLGPKGFIESAGARATLLSGVPTGPPSAQDQVTAAGIIRQGMSTKSPAPSGDQPGLIEQGNIDLAARPVVQMPDGSIATVRSMSIGEDGKEVLIPTISDDGKVLTEQQAIAQYKETGKHLGKFKTSNEASEYAKKLSAAQGAYYGSPAGPTIPATGPGTVAPQPATGPAASPTASASPTPAVVANTGLPQHMANADAQHVGRVGLATQQAFIKDVKANWGAGADYKKQFERGDPSITPEFIASLRQAGAIAAAMGDTKFQRDIEEEVLKYNAKRGLRTIPLHSDQITAINELGQQIKDAGGTSMAAADITDALLKQSKDDAKLATDDPTKFFKQNTPGAQIDPLDYSKPAALQRGIQQRMFAAQATATEKQTPLGNPFMSEEREELAGIISGPDRKVAATTITALNALSPEMVGAVMKGGAQNPVRMAVLGAAVGSDPVAMTAANQFLDKQHREDPNGFVGKFGVKAFDDLSLWRGWKDSFSAEQISENFMRSLDPAQTAVNAEITKATKKELENVDVATVVGKMGGWFFKTSKAPADFSGIKAQDGAQAARFVAEYKEIYTALRQQRVPAEKAEKAATEKLGLKYGWSEVDGKLMAYPPDKYFGEVEGSRSYLSKQLNDAIDQYGLKGLSPEAAALARSQGDQPYSLHALVADVKTEGQLPTFDDPQKRPSYVVVLLNNKTGEYEKMTAPDGNDRFTFDENIARQEAVARVNEADPMAARVKEPDYGPHPFRKFAPKSGTTSDTGKPQLLTPQDEPPSLTPEFRTAITAEMKKTYPNESDEQINERVEAVGMAMNAGALNKRAQDWVPGAAEFGINMDAFEDRFGPQGTAPESTNIEDRRGEVPPKKPPSARR